MYLVEAYGALTGDYMVIGVFANSDSLKKALRRTTPVQARRIRISVLMSNAIRSFGDVKYQTAQEFIDE